MKYNFVFDIGLGSNGVYHTAIELTHTHKIDKRKIQYCINNNIQLLEIKTLPVYNNQKEKTIQCSKVWERDINGVLTVSDKYKKLFEKGTK